MATGTKTNRLSWQLDRKEAAKNATSKIGADESLAWYMGSRKIKRIYRVLPMWKRRSPVSVTESSKNESYQLVVDKQSQEPDCSRVSPTPVEDESTSLSARDTCQWRSAWCPWGWTLLLPAQKFPFPVWLCKILPTSEGLWCILIRPSLLGTWFCPWRLLPKANAWSRGFMGLAASER